MPILYYPFFLGAQPLSVEEQEPVVVAPRWTEISGTAKAWQAGPRAGVLPRFNRIYQQEAGAPQFERTTDAVN